MNHSTSGRVTRGYPQLADGHSMYELARELYPICRSITGEGVRQTLRRLADFVPLVIHEVSSGTRVLDWTVPPEWNLRDAWIQTTGGQRVIDVRNSNLHVVSYSMPVRARVVRDELMGRLHSLRDHPQWIPYRTSYYSETWGFCVTEQQRQALNEEQYDVCIDSTLAPGSLSYGEIVLPGTFEDEVLLSTHVCHPSLANDNLSGLVTLLAVTQFLMGRQRRLTYRIVFAPGTIGAITWLALNDRELRVRHGLVVCCVGDRGAFTYKRSRQETAEIDRAMAYVLCNSGRAHSIRPFSPDGYDERQYCSPGYDLPVGRLTRTPNGEYPEYHSSADNLDLIAPESLEESSRVISEVLEVIDGNETLTNQHPKGEPQLGKRGLYSSIGGRTGTAELDQAMKWVLNLSDGQHTLLDAAERSGMRFSVLRSAADVLIQHDLLR